MSGPARGSRSSVAALPFLLAAAVAVASVGAGRDRVLADDETAPAEEPLDEAAAVEEVLVEASRIAARSIVSLELVDDDGAGADGAEDGDGPSLDDLLRLLPRRRLGGPAAGPVSAVLLDEEGTLVTALEHFPRAIRTLKATLPDGRQVDAEPRGIDYRLRLVVFALPDGWKDGVDPARVRPIAFRSDGEAPTPGTFCAALGAGYGEPGKPSVTFGLVSASDRFFGRALQTDAKVDRGSRGGALIDLDGRLLGVPVQMDLRAGSNSGVAFAVHAALIRELIPRLRTGEDLLPSFLGVTLPVVDRVDTLPGVPVFDVVAETAAATAGIRTGDRILAVDGTALRGSNDLRRVLGLAPSGTKLLLTVRRRTEDLEVAVTLGTRS